MWITITDREGVVIRRWFVGDEEKIEEIEEKLGNYLVLANDPDDFAFLTS